ncbi:hypothetical protein QBC39DRAFT_125812 [Podospora conica]|nr:hypothetical protein QBC39DRAFT_125812 [Schizothecium conicum]
MSETQPPSPGATPSLGGDPPPSPPRPYYGDPATLPHNSIRANIVAAGVICWALAAVFVAMRFYTRTVLIRVLSWTDWCVLLALVFSAGDLIALIDQVVHGSGAHIWDLDPTAHDDAIAWFRATWYGMLMYFLSLLFSKLSILFLYIHIFTYKWARLAGQVLMAIVILTSVFMLVATVTACIPLEAYWNFFIPRESVYCHPQGYWWANTGMHMVTDFLIFLLPLPVVWGIRLPRRQKFMLFSIFGLGFVVCVISIVRLVELDRHQKRMAPGAPPYDFTYAAGDISYITSVELNGAIICASCLTLKPLVARYAPRWLGSLGSRGEGAAAANARGPPTIGSERRRPPAVGGIDGELMRTVGEQEPKLGNAWSVAVGGYVEIDESKKAWVDIETGETEKVVDERAAGSSTEEIVQRGVRQ